MKCPKCGYVTSESRQNCGRCGHTLHLAARSPVADPPDQDNITVGSSTQPDPAGRLTVPEWRKQVTEKVKAYGERKKYLTTPPGPLKDTAAADTAAAPSAAPIREDHPPVQQRSGAAARTPVVMKEQQRPTPKRTPERIVVPAAPVTVEKPPAAAAAAAAAATPAAAQLLKPRPTRILLDVEADDFKSLDLVQDEKDEDYSEQPVELYLLRRGVALLIDTAILLALHFFLIYVCAQIIGYDYPQLLAQAWQPFLGVFFLFHCVYYLYFYRTSRQTPGQVFLGIELRDPASGTIRASKILIRWACMVFLNVLNFFTLFESRKYLLLDRISGTEIRKLR